MQVEHTETRKDQHRSMSEEMTEPEAMAAAFKNAADSLLDSFMLVDANRDAYVEMKELRPLLKSLGLNLDEEGVKKIINLFDDNEDGEMDFLEFIEFFSYGDVLGNSSELATLGYN